jgi:hypothetical protein
LTATRVSIIDSSVGLHQMEDDSIALIAKKTMSSLTGLKIIFRLGLPQDSVIHQPIPEEPGTPTEV